MTVEIIAIGILGVLVLRQSCAIRSELLASLRKASRERAELSKQISHLMQHSVNSQEKVTAEHGNCDTTKYAALPCDIVMTAGSGFLSRAIRVFTRQIGESPTKVNHVGIVVTKSRHLGDAVIVEALWKVRRHPLEMRYGSGESDVAIYRPLNLTDQEKDIIVAAASSYEGRSYGILKIFLHLLDSLLLGIYLFRRLGCMDDYPICSWLVAYSFAKAEKDFGVDPGAATPDDIWDFVNRRDGKYSCVKKLGRL